MDIENRSLLILTLVCVISSAVLVALCFVRRPVTTALLPTPQIYGYIYDVRTGTLIEIPAAAELDKAASY